jgi:hypothetical protein
MFNQNSSFYALLIGINYYSPNRLSNGSSYNSLKGCVRDINQVEQFLNQLPIPPNQIIKLTASNSEHNLPIEPPEQLPTYKNIIKAFQNITQIAKSGDRIYIHYSGHGGRAKTIYPQIKGKSGQDETLVPTDIGNENGRYLRDLELAYLLQQMVDKQLDITVILDSCHSGGAVRGEDEAVRGLGTVDHTPRPQDSLVTSPEELVQNWQNITGKTQNKAGTRGGAFLKGMLPQDVKTGYILLAACRPHESAYEYAFEGTERNGALTYWLLKTLTPDPYKLMITYKILHDYINANIRQQFHQKQTPVLIGESDRLIFGYESIPTEYTAIVTQINREKTKYIQLNIGEIQGLETGAEFILYPFGTTTFSEDKKLALVKLVEVEGATAWAEVETAFSETSIQVGDLAILTLVSPKLMCKVYLLEDETLPTEINQKLELEKIKNSISRKTRIEFVDDIEIADYCIKITILDTDKAAQYQAEAGEIIYEICQRNKVPIQLKPALKINQTQSISSLIKRLIHLAKYQAVKSLKNRDPLSPMRDKIAVRLTTEPNPDQILEPTENQNEVIIDTNKPYYLEIQNNYSRTVYLAVFSLQSNYAISSVIKENLGLEHLSLEPQQKEIIPLQNIAENNSLQNLYKICVSVDETNFNFLELPPLDQQKQSVRDTPKNPLEQLFQEMTADQPPDRNVSLAPLPSWEWTTVQFTIKNNLF